MTNFNSETASFTQIFNQYKKAFTLFANSYVRDMAAAEDIYMEAVAVYWRRKDELPADTNVPAYILTCVKNKAISHLRHQSIASDIHTQRYEHSLREFNFRIASLEECNPYDLFTDEIEQIVQKTLDEVPALTREIFVRSRIRGDKNRIIAEELNVSVKTIEFHISKALKILRISLKDYLPVLLVLLCNLSKN